MLKIIFYRNKPDLYYGSVRIVSRSRIERPTNRGLITDSRRVFSVLQSTRTPSGADMAL
jgi:hypothetical protein